MWSTLKSLLPSKKLTHIYTHTGDKQKNHDVANHFNENFASVSQIQDDQFDTIFEVDAELNENNGLINNQQNLKFSPVSTGEVLKLVRKIPLGKAFGMDGINGRFFKSGANVLAKPLAFIFPLRLQSGIVPDE